LHDALLLPGFPLSKEQKKVVLKRARMSFVRLFIQYIRESGNISKAIKSIGISGIGVTGFLRGFFGSSISKIKQFS
jgi:hypothetical protein